jgi:hypothetical protein
MFSHNEAKVEPGLRVVFNTAENTMDVSTFSI